MVAPNARRLDGTVAEDIRFAHAALDKLSGGNVVGGISCHSTYRQDAPFSSSFTVYPFGVWRLVFGVWRLAFGVWRARPRLRSFGLVDEACDAPSAWRGAALPRCKS